MKRFVFPALVFTALFLPLANAATIVTTTKASELITYPVQSAPAKLVAINHSKVPTQIAALLSELKVQVGDKVDKNSVLAELDCTSYALLLNAEKSRLQQSQQQAAYAEREFKRGQVLADKKHIGEAELDQRENNHLIASAAAVAQQAITESAQLNVSRCQILSPFTGIVTKRLANVGEMLNPGQAIVELLQTQYAEVSAKISQADQDSFMGAAKYLFVANGVASDVALRQQLPFIEENTRAREARFTINKEQWAIGTVGRLEWFAPVPHLPAHLLQMRQGVKGFFVSRNGIAEFIAVAGAEEGRAIAFSAKLDDDIIVDGRHGLQPGEAVTLAGASVQGSH